MKIIEKNEYTCMWEVFMCSQSCSKNNYVGMKQQLVNGKIAVPEII